MQVDGAVAVSVDNGRRHGSNTLAVRQIRATRTSSNLLHFVIIIKAARSPAGGVSFAASGVAPQKYEEDHSRVHDHRHAGKGAK
jgi:hypothetical protein